MMPLSTVENGGGGDDLLVDELLRWLDDGAPSTHAAEAIAAQPSSAAAAAVVQFCRRRPRIDARKRLIDSVYGEVHALTEELERLRRPSPAQVAALSARWQRRRAEHECQQLRDAVTAQTQFIRGLRSVFSAPPSLSAGLNGYRLLHKPTRLPRARPLRQQEYAALADEARLRRATEMLCRETESLSLHRREDGDGEDQDQDTAPSLDKPFIHTELTSDRDGFNLTATYVYALPATDIAAALRGVWVAFRDSSVKCCAYTSTSRESEIVDPDATMALQLPVSVQYCVEGIQYKNDAQDCGIVVGESRSVTFSTQWQSSDNSETTAAVLWDSIDEDELHEFHAATNVTRKAVGACLLRRELCDDGVERVVSRGLLTRRFVLRKEAKGSSFEQLKTVFATHMHGCELLFRQSIFDSIADEARILERVARSLTQRVE